MRKLFLLLTFIFAACQFALAQVPTLGTYPATTVATAGSNVTITPSTIPTNAATIFASTSTNFKGLLHVNPITGKVTVTNAQPAGNYSITVKAFNGVSMASTTFSLLVNNAVCSQGQFTEGANNITGNSNKSLAVGDFNNDSKQDIVLVTSNNTVLVLLGNGTSGFTTASTVPTNGAPQFVAVSDFNGDGNLDFATTNFYSNDVSIRLGNGAGGFSGTTNVSVESYPYALAVNDFNGDNKQDIAVVNYGTATVSIRLGDGAGNFTGSSNFAAGSSSPTSIATGDFNNDGKQDLAVGNYNNNSVSIYLGDGMASFINSTVVPIGGQPNQIGISDFNGDGIQDLAVVNAGFTVSIRLGNGTGGFSGTNNVPVGNFPLSIAIADFNGDGKNDFVTANQIDNSVSVRLGDGTGNFSISSNVRAEYNPKSIVVGDFNNDGRQDFTTGVFAGGTLSFGINKSELADINLVANNSSIIDGDNTPSNTDFTDFGDVAINLTRSFTIQNTGTANLSVKNIFISGLDSTLFTISGIGFPTSIIPGSAATFSIKFTPLISGLKTARVNILNDDCDEGVYDFAIQGAAVAVVPTIGTYPVTTIPMANGNVKIYASVAPANAFGITAFASPNFKGLLNVDSLTGLVNVTNAHPAGTYTVTIKAIHGFSSATTSFVLIVNNSNCGNVGTATTKSVGTNPYSVAVGDFNNDGKQDFALANSSSGAASIRLGNGAGSFSGSTEINTGTGQRSIVIGNFNGDGYQDFAVCNSNNTVSIRLGDGTGSFSGNITIPVGAGAFSITLGDFNGDGKQDFVTANATANSISVRFGDGTGNFSGSTEIAVGSKPNSAAISDFNNDGKQDIAVANYSSGTVSILIGDGTGGFIAAAAVSVIGGANSIATGDFNADGKQDFVTANMPNNTVSVRLGNGSGGFSGNLNIAVTQYPYAIIVGDFNGDGKPDFATANYSNSIVSIRFGDGTGDFSGNTNVAVGSSPYAIAVGDFNADGRQDFITANYSSNNVSICLGSANEINVAGNNINIPDGDNVPAVADNTDFGRAGNSIRSFTIQNTGLANLSVTNITLSGVESSLFSVSSIAFPSIILPDSSVTFTVRFLPVSTGIKTARVNIFNDDCDEAVYDFAVQGTGVLPTLGTYPNTIVANASNNAVVNPSTVPTNTTGISAYTSTNFKGLLQVDTATGRVIITNAHPAGTYTITIKAFNGFITTLINFPLLVNTTKCSQSLFYKSTVTPVGGSPKSVAISDFNKDGNQDFAIANGGNGVAIRLGNGAGGLSGSTLITCGSVTQSIAVGDFNNDGKQDFAVTNYLDNSVSIRLGDGTGGFTANAEVSVSLRPECIALGDFNGDGIVDLATGSIISNNVSVRIGDGSGSFSGSLNLSSSCSTAILVGDFNNDGKQDLAVTHATPTPSGYDDVSIFTGNGSGGFTETGRMAVGDNPNAIALIDLNNDNNQDFVVANSSGGISRAFGTGTGNFSVYTNLNDNSGYSLLSTGDFNGDGRQDIVLGVNKGVGTSLGKGIGEFGGGGGFGVTTGPYSMAVGDFNNDGLQDIVVGGNTDSISLWLGGVSEINVKGNNTNISTGDTSSDSAHNTDFGNVSNQLVRSFTIQNPGTGILTVNSIAMSGADSTLFGFSRINLPATVPAGDSITFIVSFVPTSTGLKTTKVRISNDNCYKALYEFAIQGTGVAITSTLGTYPHTTISFAGGDTTIIPSAPPTNAANVTASTSPNFKGVLQVNPLTGIITITNAHPAGSYMVNVKINGLLSIKDSFNLIVNNANCGNPAGNSNVVVGKRPFGVAIGDFNNDGKQDIAVTNRYENTVTIRYGDGAGGFNGNLIVPIGSSPEQIEIVDINGDGWQDFIVGSSYVSIGINNGFGGFTVSTGNAMPATLPIATGDFNGDGKPDFASNTTSSGIVVWAGNGAGGFTKISTIPFTGYSIAMATADFNNDGKPDIAIADFGGNKIAVHIGNGTGGFSSANNIPVGIYPNAITPGDFNNDGKQDLVVANLGDSSVILCFGNGDGTFNAPVNLNIKTICFSIAVNDFNGDGKADFVTANMGDYFSGSASIYFGNGTGKFITPSSVPAGSSPYTVAVGDFNKDGKPDFAVANSGDSTVSIRLSSSNDINLKGNNVNIADGDNTPDSTDFTNFGNAGDITRTFTIQNTGPVNLTIRSIAITGLDSLMFTAGGITLPAIITPGTSKTFTTRFIPVSTGIKTAVVHISSDNCSKGDYDFAVQGNGVTPTLSTYPTTAIALSGGNATVTPSALPVLAANLSVYTSPDFKGVLQVNPVSGVVKITNAYPAGTYMITVKANGVPAVTSFVLTVNKPNCSQGLFTSNSSVSAIGNNASGIAIGDFNGDGKHDFVVANYASNSVSIRLGDGIGGYTYYGTNTNVPTGANPVFVAVGDFNSDGKLDFVASNYSSNNVTVALCTGTGEYLQTKEIAVGANPQSVTVADFNNDGKLDFATANFTSNTVSVCLGNGLGDFITPVNISVGIGPYSIAAGDFNGDGKTDFATANSTDNMVSIRLGDGAGGFGNSNAVSVGSSPRSIVIADFNNDGKPDFATANFTSNTVSVCLGNGAGGFGIAINTVAGINPQAVASADFNGDGQQDLAVANAGSNYVSVRLGNGAGSFIAIPNSVISGSSPRSLAIADFNNDGKQDLVVPYYTSNIVAIRLGTDKEINLLGNNTTIAAGNNSPDSAHNTNFGTINTGSTITRTFTIQNTGTDTLKINGILITGADSTSFIKNGIALPAKLLTGASATFTVTFAPSDGGVKSARVNILNNDCDESLYDFSIQGKAICTNLSASNMWLGITSDWNLISNWSLGAVPNGCGIAVINDGVPFMPVVNISNAICYKLILNNGATVTVANGGHLTITGN